ncbi:hypothetical protein Skr01_73790 [Sphaerisporangium krabiense]|uniref:Uncharacterized protein n=1 Tax=Sphaerisporangium krabiense TaxID=763782 RepID=A0A7W8Z0A6_9ACTN|nr:hypothetical protein [Sphaerisporangium krabiense]MBB5625107.1 hypothetical protein [Sphaerisporangium krabiense]GII67294.1 hypothetical protein Skr01_73790 [Sphaerisporangium krabiense]
MSESPHSPHPPQVPRTPSVWALPWHTLRLAGRCLLPLVMWYSAGQLLRMGLLVGGTELSHGSMRDLRLALTMLVFIVMVMASLIVTAGMFASLRGALWEIRARRADGEQDERFSDGLSRVMVPFVILYLSWGWYTDDVRDFFNTDVQRQSAQYGALGAFADFATGSPMDTGRGLIDLSYTVTLAIMVGAFVGRYFCNIWYERAQSRTAALSLALCELSFFYYGAQVIASRGDWVSGRVAFGWWENLRGVLNVHIPGWETFWGWAGEVWPYAWDALVLPAVWLTVAILMYGAYAEDTRTVIRGTRLEGRAARAGDMITARTHSLTRQILARFFGRWGHWVPLAHTVRLTVRGGAPLFGLFALCFVALRVGEDYTRRGLLYLIGTDHPQLYWNVLLVPGFFAIDLAVTVLTTCLLAATFDIAAGAERRRRATAVSGRTAETARTRPSQPVPSGTAPAPLGPPVPSGPRSPG